MILDYVMLFFTYKKLKHTAMNLQEITTEIGEIAKDAGAFIKSQQFKITPDDVKIKEKASLVTYVDKESEKMIVERVKKILPDAGFITEEGTTTQEKGETYQWIIDPLDGTTNFIHDLCPHSVSIALTKNNIPISGVVYDIGQDELFSAWKDGGAWMNGKRIFVSKVSTHVDALIATGFPYYNFDVLDKYIEALKFFMIETQGIRRMGSAAVDLAYLACGRYDGFFEHALHAWDIAAGIIMVKEAGGKICDFKGGDNYLFGGEIIAANPNYFSEFSKKIQKFLE